MGATNKQIYDAILPLVQSVAELKKSVEDIVKRLDRQNGSIDSHTKALFDVQGDIRILKLQAKADASKHKTVNSRVWAVLMLVIGVALAVLQALVITGLTELRDKGSAEHDALAVCEALQTPATPALATHAPTQGATPAPRPDPKPSPLIAPTTHDATQEEITYLAALCYVEVRGMRNRMASACASVVDTVYKRMTERKFSDGTVAGTLTFDCDPGDAECHFPAYVVNGCAEFANCPYNSPEQMRLFEAIVSAYLSGALRPVCSGFIYYGMQPFDDNECTIVDTDSGQFINFHN